MFRLFEFEDQKWFPKVLRNGITDYLRYAVDRIDLYDPIIPVMKRWLKNKNEEPIVDIASGGGGGIIRIFEKLKKEGLDIKVVLTDKFPNVEAYEFIKEKTNGQITFRHDSIDALDIPEDLKGARTMFVSLHHFSPEQAKTILENAKKEEKCIAVFEFTERNFINFILNFFAPIVVMIAVAFIKPFKWSRFLFTYVLPFIPLAVMWDGFVSVLRTYTVKELEKMVEKIGSDDYTWEIGRIKVKSYINIIYLVGCPIKN